jgi:hypothetical protein
VVVEEELEVEERMSAGMGWRMVLDGIPPSARMILVRAIRKLGEWRNQVWGGWGWTAARGVRDGHQYKEKEKLLEFCSGQACFVSFRFRLCLQQESLEGPHRGILIVFCQDEPVVP